MLAMTCSDDSDVEVLDLTAPEELGRLHNHRPVPQSDVVAASTSRTRVHCNEPRNAKRRPARDMTGAADGNSSDSAAETLTFAERLKRKLNGGCMAMPTESRSTHIPTATQSWAVRPSRPSHQEEVIVLDDSDSEQMQYYATFKPSHDTDPTPLRQTLNMPNLAATANAESDMDSDLPGLDSLALCSQQSNTQPSLPSPPPSHSPVGSPLHHTYSPPSPDPGSDTEAPTQVKPKKRRPSPSSAAEGQVSREEARRLKAEEKLRLQEEKKRARELAKETARREKEEKKAAEKAEKAQKKTNGQAARGNFCANEIMCVIERSAVERPNGSLVLAGAKTQDEGKEVFDACTGESEIPGAVWWTRRAYLEGGAAAKGPGVQTLDLMAVLCDPVVFVDQLAITGKPPCLYPALDNMVERIKESAAEFKRFILVLEGVPAQVAKLTRDRYKTGQTAVSNSDLDDAMAWLFVHKEVETRITKGPAETGQYLWDLTRGLAKAPYQDQVTELHCVSRKKSTMDLGYGEGEGKDGGANEAELVNTWLRQLQMIPGLSEARAKCLVRVYPTCRSLVAALTNPALPVRQAQLLLEDKLGARRATVLSERVYAFFTAQDGDQVLM